MKRILVAVLLAGFASVSLAAGSQYSNDAGQQDWHHPEVG